MKTNAKVTAVITALLTLAALAVACSSDKTKTYENQITEDKQQLTARLQNEINRVDSTVTQLKSNLATQAPDVKEAVERRINQLDSMRVVLGERLSGLESSTEKQWDRVRAEASGAIDAAENYIKNYPDTTHMQPAESTGTSATGQ